MPSSTGCSIDKETIPFELPTKITSEMDAGIPKNMRTTSATRKRLVSGHVFHGGMCHIPVFPMTNPSVCVWDPFGMLVVLQSKRIKF